MSSYTSNLESMDQSAQRLNYANHTLMRVRELEQQLVERDAVIASLTVLTPSNVHQLSSYNESQRCDLLIKTLDLMPIVCNSIRINLEGSSRLLTRNGSLFNEEYSVRTRTLLSSLVNSPPSQFAQDASFPQQELHKLISNLVLVDIIDGFWM